MEYALYTAISAFALTGLVVIMIEIGRRQGVRHRGAPGSPALEGAVFGLMSLLLAFTFSGAAERFDQRRHLVIEEANAIATAYRRIDLLPPATQPPIRDTFRRYVDARLEIYRKLPDLPAAMTVLAKAEVLQDRIWALALPASYGGTSPSTTILVVNSLNPMFDIANTRTGAARRHPPAAIYVLLVLSTLVSALLAGFGMGVNQGKSLLHLGAFALMLAVTLYVIVDLEYPRAGLIRVDSVDQMLVDVRSSMR